MMYETPLWKSIIFMLIGNIREEFEGRHFAQVAPRSHSSCWLEPQTACAVTALGWPPELGNEVATVVTFLPH